MPDEPLIQEGEAIVYDEAVRSFVAAGDYLLKVQKQAEPFVCGILKDVRVDPGLEMIVRAYENQIGE